MNAVALGEETTEKSIHDPEALEKHQGESEFHNQKKGIGTLGTPFEGNYRYLTLCKGGLVMESIRCRINYYLIIVKFFFDFPKIKL
jgi:hypothetical protein